MAIHIYYGEGKGKTTAAIGLSIRFAGSGGRVLFCQFLKSEATAERALLRKIPEITLPPLPEQLPFFKDMSPEEKEAVKIYERVCFAQYQQEVLEGHYGLLILDELLPAIKNGIFTAKEIAVFLREKPQIPEIVITGRYAPSELLELADYATEMKKRKHPYDQGVTARKGIEY